MAKKQTTTVPITARISVDLHARIERIRAEASLRPGDITGAPSWAAVIRWAIEEWADRQEQKLKKFR